MYRSKNLKTEKTGGTTMSHKKKGCMTDKEDKRIDREEDRTYYMGIRLKQLEE